MRRFSPRKFTAVGARFFKTTLPYLSQNESNSLSDHWMTFLPEGHTAESILTETAKTEVVKRLCLLAWKNPLTCGSPMYCYEEPARWITAGLWMFINLWVEIKKTNSKNHKFLAAFNIQDKELIGGINALEERIWFSRLHFGAICGRAQHFLAQHTEDAVIRKQIIEARILMSLIMPLLWQFFPGIKTNGKAWAWGQPYTHILTESPQPEPVLLLTR